MIFNQISQSIETLSEHIIDTDISCDIAVSPIDAKDYDCEFLKPVLKIKEIVNSTDTLEDLIIHGSIADLNYIKGWSDFDSTAIIRCDVINDIQKMNELRDISMLLHEEILKIDPLQHHGIQFITDKDLLIYPETYLPTVVYNSAKSLNDNLILKFAIRDSKFEQVARFISTYQTFQKAVKEGKLYHHAKDGICLEDNFKNYKNTMYQMKYYLSVIMILPSYFLNLKEIYCTKKDSFEICKDLITPKNWEIIEKATNVRNRWKGYSQIDNKIPGWVRKEIGENYFLQGYNLIEEMREKILSDLVADESI
jgi:hypothetical protein